MKTVKQLREALSGFPDDATCHAYEGEVTGIVVTDPSRRGAFAQIGVILCSGDDAMETELHVRDARGNVFIVDEEDYAAFVRMNSANPAGALPNPGIGGGVQGI